MGPPRTLIRPMLAACLVGLAVSACGGSSTVTTVIEQVPASGTITAGSGPATVTATVSQSTTAAQAAVPPCDGTTLFAAAVAKEHINPNSPQYVAGQGPGASAVNCDGSWATASVSRPAVGDTDGVTLFEATADAWHEVAQLGPIAVECNLEENGVPANVATVLGKGVRGASVVGCDDPDAYSEAQAEWKSADCDDAAAQSGDFKAVALSLMGAQPDYAGNPGEYTSSIAELNQLATLPDTDVTTAQAAEIQSDQRALDGFFDTPGLFVSAAQPSCS